MPKRISILILLLVGLLNAQAQQKLNFSDVDAHSYELYLQGKWPELIEYSTHARQQGIDFFYLQVRTGIAWYNLGKYRNASTWFLKAYKNDQSFDWLQEYVYYSLVYSGQNSEALKYASRFSDAEKKRIGFKASGLTRIAYEAGYSLNSDFDQLKKRSFSVEANLGDNYGEAYLLKNYNFHSVDLSHRISPGFSLNHNITYIGMNRLALVDWGTQSNSSIRINQFSYYINPVWIIGKKLNISPSLSLIFGSGEVYAGSLNGNSAKTFNLSTINYNDQVFSTSIWSNYKLFSPGLEVNAGKLNDTKFTQFSAWFTFYPLSNAKLYLTPVVYFRSTSGASFIRNSAGLSGGIQIGMFHLFGQYLFGDMENFVESNGYVISNFAGMSKRKIMGSLYFPIYKKYQFVIRYIGHSMVEKYQVYSDGTKSNSLEYNYLKNTITGGISWNF